MIECFGSGTAVIVCPVKNLNYNGKDYPMPINPEFGSGNLTKKLLDWVMDIQYGVTESDWCKVINWWEFNIVRHFIINLYFNFICIKLLL